MMFGLLAGIFFIIFIVLFILWRVKVANDRKKAVSKEKQMQTLTHQTQMSGYGRGGYGGSGYCNNCNTSTGGMTRCPSCGESV
jgi:hypothetical protein